MGSRAFSVIILGALFCTLAVKLFHAYRNNLMGYYLGWVLGDIAVLLMIEVVFSLVYFGWPKKPVFRVLTSAAAVVCTWSVINAMWLIRTGSQIVPSVLLPLVRDPINSFVMVGINIIKMPIAAFNLLFPSALALTFFFIVLTKAPLTSHNRKLLAVKTIAFVMVIVGAVFLNYFLPQKKSVPMAAIGLRYNAQLRAVTFFFGGDAGRIIEEDLNNSGRTIAAFDEVRPGFADRQVNHNVVMVVLEGVQYRHTSLYNRSSALTPFLVKLAEQGVEFANFRSTLAHTTKSLFGLLTGRYPSMSQDIAEAVPARKPYASVVTILSQQMDMRSAFFQSAKGNFESRPGLVYNMGFDKFWTRDDLGDPNLFIGYLSCDEFAMLKPISEWIKADTRPFFLTVLCSVTHDPYEVPKWFGEPPQEHVQKYRQSISYTDKFIEALYKEIGELGFEENTIFCVVGDHGEAFGEHGLNGHERIAFDEVLQVPWVMSAPGLIQKGTKMTGETCSGDVAVTLLTLLGFDTAKAGFDGTNVLGIIPADRKIYFSGWIYQSPMGYVQGDMKYIYDPTEKELSAYNLKDDPYELIRVEVEPLRQQKIIEDVTGWRKANMFRIDQQQRGSKKVFGVWQCSWVNRVSKAKYEPVREK